MKIKILYLSWMGQLGGAEVALLRLVQALDRQTHEIHVWQFKEGPLGEKLTRFGAKVTVRPTARFLHLLFKPWLFWELANYMKRNHIQLVHAVGTLSYVLGWVSASLAKKPILWWLVDQPLGKDPFEKIARNTNPNTIVFNSNFTREAYKKLYANQNGGYVVYPSIDLDPKESEQSFDEMSQELGVGKEHLVVLHVGRMQRWKGQHILVQAIPEIIRTQPQARFLFLGGALPGMEQTYQQELIALAKQLGIESYCRFLGFRQEADPFYARADLVVHTSISPEPFGLVVAEAMAYQKALVASRVGGPAEMIVDRKEGWLIDPNDSQALAEAVSHLLGDASLRDTLGAQAHEKIKGLCDSKVIAKKMSEIYQSVLQSAP